MAANDASTAAAAAANVLPPPPSDAVRSRDWMFCPVTGALLELDAERGVAWSPISGFERRLEGNLKSKERERHWLVFEMTSQTKTKKLSTSTSDRALPTHTKQKNTDLDSVSIVSKTDIHDYRRRYKLTPLGPDAVGKDGSNNQPVGGATDATSRVRSTVDEACVKCGHRGLEFYTMQLRSADEGSTVFYECPECQHTWNQNN